MSYTPNYISIMFTKSVNYNASRWDTFVWKDILLISKDVFMCHWAFWEKVHDLQSITMLRKNDNFQPLPMTKRSPRVMTCYFWQVWLKIFCYLMKGNKFPSPTQSEGPPCLMQKKKKKSTWRRTSHKHFWSSFQYKSITTMPFEDP